MFDSDLAAVLVHCVSIITQIVSIVSQKSYCRQYSYSTVLCTVRRDYALSYIIYPILQTALHLLK